MTLYKLLEAVVNVFSAGEMLLLLDLGSSLCIELV